MMRLHKHLYNGLLRPPDYSIFAPEWNRPPAGDVLARKDCVLACVQWAGLRSSRANVGMRQTPGHRDGQVENIMPRCPLQAMLHIACREIKGSMSQLV